MTIEDRLKMIIGEQVFAITSLSVQLAEAQNKIAELTKLIEAKPKEG